ncbi:MAG: hypothetical protein JO241_10440 [Candidatus Eremiobacteraeota bacterium]|nr:hypothetical protein [Candidatus Eremiobacteraeota bacterium]
MNGTLIDASDLEERASAALRDELAALEEVKLSDAATGARFRQIASKLVSTCGVPRPGVVRALQELRSLGVPIAVLARGMGGVEQSKARVINYDGLLVVSDDVGDSSDEALFGAVRQALDLPVEAIWYATADAEEAAAASRFGFNVVPIAKTVDEVLDAIREPYTRSLLGLRYIMRTALEWRPGHVVNPQDLER